jgi:flagellar assembly factor FliW
MPECLTKYHGEMEYDESAALHFPRGLFGFESETRFLTIVKPDLRPLIFLQSLATAELCFICLPVLLVDREYCLSLRSEDLDAVELPSGRPLEIGAGVECLVIVRIQPGGPTTANLLAPVVINLGNSRAIQAVSMNQKHTHQVPLQTLSEEPVCS